MTRRALASIRTRLVVLVFLALLPALALLLYSGAAQREQDTADVLLDARRHAAIMAADQSEQVAGAHQLLALLARLPAVQADDTSACQGLLENLLPDYPAYTNLTAIRPDGSVACSAPPASDQINLADRAYFQRAVASGDFATGDFIIGRLSGKPSIDFAYPVRDAGGRLQRVVAVGLDLTWLNRRLADETWPPGTVLAVVDQGGTIVASYPDPSAIGQSVRGRIAGDYVLAQREGATRAPDVGGRPYLLGFATTNVGTPAADVHVVLGVPEAVALAPANNVLARTLGLLALASVLALLAAWSLGNRLIARPVLRLVASAKRLAAGDLSARSGPPYGGGELGRLGQDFDGMAADIEVAYLATVQVLAAAVEARDVDRVGHVEHVAAYALAIARQYGWQEKQLGALRMAAALHDVGKVGVPDAILRKREPLALDEHELMRQHPEHGARLLQRVPYLQPAAPVVRSHHEFYDGQGYPDHLEREAIPLAARFVAVADAFDAMTAPPPGGRGLSPAEALAEIKRWSFHQFDPDVVLALELALQQGTIAVPDAPRVAALGAAATTESAPRPARRLISASVRTRLMLIVGLAVLPALAALLYSAAEERNFDTERALADAQRLSMLAASDLQRTAVEAHEELLLLTQTPDVRADPAVCHAFLADLLTVYPMYSNLNVILPSGDVRCDARGGAGTVTLGDREYFRRALSTREFAVSDYTLDRTTGRQALVFAQPALGAGGQVDFVVSAVLDLGWLDRRLAEGNWPEGTLLSLVDPSGIVVGSYPDAGLVGQSVATRPAGRIAMATRQGTAHARGPDNTPYLFGVDTAEVGSPGTEVRVVVGIPEAIALAAADHQLTRNLQLLGGVAALALLAAWLVGDRLIVRPVHRLAAATSTLRQGDLSVRVGPPYAEGELGELAFAFDDMAHDLESAYLNTVEVLADAVETRDPYTGGHVARVSNYSLAIGRELGWTMPELMRLRMAAALHDVGKIGVPDDVLRKPGRLDDQELPVMRSHTTIGAKLLEGVPFLRAALDCALSHQEFYDGRGYPRGLAGEAIAADSRIVAIADTFDAMTTTRPYRKGLPVEVALAEIERCSGTQFDPVMVAAFMRTIASGAIAIAPAASAAAVDSLSAASTAPDVAAPS